MVKKEDMHYKVLQPFKLN